MKGGNTYVVNDAISSGKLGAELEVRDEVIPAYQDQLDELAVGIMDAVNDLHTTGYDLNGDAGVAFFTGTGAADMAVNSTILNDTDKVAAASSASSATRRCDPPQRPFRNWRIVSLLTAEHRPSAIITMPWSLKSAPQSRRPTKKRARSRTP